MIETVAAGMMPGIDAEYRHFFEVLWKQAALRPAGEAIYYQGQRFTYLQLLERCSAVAEQLLKAGIQPGDRVGLLFPNHPDYVAAFFAAAGIGAVIVPINPLLRSDEIAHILCDAQATTLIVHETALAEALKSQSAEPVLQRIFVSSTAESVNPDLLTCANPHIAITPLSREMRSPALVSWQRQIVPERDLALLVYTSGTTGKPKGAMLTHASMLSIFPARLDLFNINASDKTLAVLPMCHIYGITILMIGTLSVGGTMVILPRFEAAAALKLVQDEKVTLLPAVPAMYQFMLMELAGHSYDMSAVRLCFSGAAALPSDIIADIESAFGAVLIEGFGMTETSCVATINPLHGPRKAGSVGPPLPGLQMRVLSEDGLSLPPGAENVGELCIEGPNIMHGYWQQAEETQKVMDGGWFATGDLGYRDDDNYYYIVGRKKEMIIRGGANIYPREIEDVLLKMEEVAEAAVVGIPDKLMGERVKAVIVPKPGARLTEDCVKTFCGERLADYKVPRIVEFCDSLPRNSTGKILKRLLVESVPERDSVG